MTTDTKWTWTILMRDGKSWHSESACTIYILLEAFERAGYHEAQIEAIIRH